VWQEKAGYLDRKYKVAVNADETTTKELSFDAGKFMAYKGPKPKTLVLSASHFEH
jgi:hypothetical protein